MDLLHLVQLFVKQFPTSQATVLDIEAYVNQIEEERTNKSWCSCY
jgi:hypothetical protein